MSDLIVQGTQAAQGMISAQEIKTLEQAGIIPVGTPEAQIKVYAEICAMHKLSPFAGEVHLVGYKVKDGGMKYSVIVGIHGMENRAESTGEWAGYSEPQFDYTSDGRFMTITEIATSGKKPVSCRIQAFRIKDGQKIGTWAQVLWSEFAGSSPMWGQKPIHMLVKCAKAAAIRELFPRQTRGLYTQEEMDSSAGLLADTETETIEIGEAPPSRKPELSQSDLDRINLCFSEEEIKDLYGSNKKFYKNHIAAFVARQEELTEMYGNLESEMAAIETTEKLVEWSDALPETVRAKMQPLINTALDALQIAGV